MQRMRNMDHLIFFSQNHTFQEIHDILKYFPTLKVVLLELFLRIVNTDYC